MSFFFLSFPLLFLRSIFSLLFYFPINFFLYFSLFPPYLHSKLHIRHIWLPLSFLRCKRAPPFLSSFYTDRYTSQSAFAYFNRLSLWKSVNRALLSFTLNIISTVNAFNFFFISICFYFFFLVIVVVVVVAGGGLTSDEIVNKIVLFYYEVFIFLYDQYLFQEKKRKKKRSARNEKERQKLCLVTLYLIIYLV